jgi:hypothetical protein
MARGWLPILRGLDDGEGGGRRAALAGAALIGMACSSLEEQLPSCCLSGSGLLELCTLCERPMGAGAARLREEARRRRGSSL